MSMKGSILASGEASFLDRLSGLLKETGMECFA
jgi:hypothetical protein